MSEDTLEFLIGIWIKTVFILTAQEIQEIIHIPVMHKCAVVLGAEELTEVERLFIVAIFRPEQCPEVVCVKIYSWQRFVWVSVAHVGHVPFGFRLLLHHIVPSEYLLFLVVVEKIEWSA